jgi:preprotein translocase subunit SecG
MSVLEIVLGAALLLISVLITLICMLQEQKPQNATAALTGASNDSFYDKNRGRTKEARLRKFTTVLTILFFALILFIYIVMPLIIG